MHTKFQIAIQKTLAWFDIFDYPLTAEELHTYLWEYKVDTSYAQFLIDLETCVERSVCEEQFGYYFLPGRGRIVEERRKRFLFVEDKMRIAKRAVKKISNIPFVRAVFVCNTTAFGWPKKDSDIDTFIVVKQGRLWLARMLVTFALSLYGLRRNKKHVANKICLSFYVTDAHLDLKDVFLPDTDIYFMYWLAQLIPLYDPDNLYEDIMKLHTTLDTHIPQRSKRFVVRSGRGVDTEKKKFNIKHFGEHAWESGYGAMLEKQARSFQKAKMSRNIDSVQNADDSRVVVTDNMLKFHENDRRALYRQMWEKRCEVVLA